jgi:hypothetical protein
MENVIAPAYDKRATKTATGRNDNELKIVQVSASNDGIKDIFS